MGLFNMSVPMKGIQLNACCCGTLSIFHSRFSVLASSSVEWNAFWPIKCCKSRQKIPLARTVLQVCRVRVDLRVFMSTEKLWQKTFGDTWLMVRHVLLIKTSTKSWLRTVRFAPRTQKVSRISHKIPIFLWPPQHGIIEEVFLANNDVR